MARTKPKPIINDLFRFISLRTPQLVDPVKKELGYIFHPNPSKSKFLSKDTYKTIEKSRDEMIAVSETFKSKTRYSEIRALKSEIYDFGLWLNKNKSNLSPSILIERAQLQSELPDQTLYTIWDNFFHQCIKNNNPTLRQACVTMIIANNFVKRAKNERLQQLADEIYGDNKFAKSELDRYELLARRIVNAKIIVPKAFSRSKTSFRNGKMYPSLPGQNERKVNSASIERNQRIAISKKRSSELNEAKDNLRRAFLKNPLLRRTQSSSALKSLEETGEVSKKTISMLSNPEYQDIPLNRIYSEINDEAVKENRTYRKTVAEELRLSSAEKSSPVDDYCYMVRFDSEGKRVVFTLTLKVPKKNINIEKSQLNLNQSNKNFVKSQELENISLSTNFKTVGLFPNANTAIDQNKPFEIDGTLWLNNGKEVKIKFTAYIEDGQVVSCMTGIADTKETDEGDGALEDIVFGEEGVPLYGVNRVGVGIFRKVEQEVCCYVPGEVSRIENIMAREYKERHTRSLTSTETTTEDTTEFEVENKEDTATTTRNDMQTEVSKVLDKANDLGLGATVGASGKYMGVELSADAYADYATSTASSDSDSEAKSFAEEITRTASERILQKTSQKRTSKILQEFEENNRHGYDNREGDQHVTGVYRWVDIIYTNRLVNYGARLMVEFLIPEPAKFYREKVLGIIPKNEKETSTGTTSSDPNAPNHPSAYRIFSPSDIEGYWREEDDDKIDFQESAFYETLASHYNIAVSGPPAEKISISKSFANKGELDKTTSFDGGGTMAIPPDYLAKTAKITGTFRHDARNSEGTHWRIDVGGEIWKYNYQKKGNNDRTFTIQTFTPNHENPPWFLDAENGAFLNFDPELIQTLDVKISGNRTLSYNISVVLTAEISEEAYLEWQTTVYNKLLDTYEAQLAAYNAEKEAETAKEQETLESAASRNPKENRAIEQREIKRVALEMLTEPYVASGSFQMGEGFYSDNDCAPKVNQTLEWEQYSSHVKFFEQAFDWQLMAYLFYPYYWAEKCAWADLLKIQDADDPVFQGFLQSGMARLVVPVRQGFHNAVNLYFETGKIWNGGDMVLDTDDDLYLSIDQEIVEPKSIVEGEWETRIPTTLTIIQGDSVFLKDEGLPCCDDLTEEGVITGLEGSKAQLGQKSSHNE